MKRILFLLFLLNLTFSFSQKGFRVIRKAEKKIEQGKYDKALKLLDRAASMNYGFCGNAWLEAREEIIQNRVRIFDAQGEFLNAANALNSSDYLFFADTDSLKMVYFILAYDKKSIKSEIDSCLNLMQSFEIADLYTEIQFDVSFSEAPLSISYSTLQTIKSEMFQASNFNTETPLLDRFKFAVRKQPFYRLLE